MPKLPACLRASIVVPTVFLAAGLTACTTTDEGTATSTSAAATVTATVTVTETVSPLPDAPTALESPDEQPPSLELEVFRDGCGVIRSEADPGVTYQNLQWTVTDRDGFDVLGRNAEGETHMRYFLGGSYTVVLESFWDGAYRPVSNEVQISC